MTNQVVLTARVTPETHKEIEKYVKERKTDTSSVLREIIERFFNDKEKLKEDIEHHRQIYKEKTRKLKRMEEEEKKREEKTKEEEKQRKKEEKTNQEIDRYIKPIRDEMINKTMKKAEADRWIEEKIKDIPDRLRQKAKEKLWEIAGKTITRR